VLIGEPCGGGVLAYILRPGNRGYVRGERHGLIAAPADQTPADSGIQWATQPYRGTSVPGALGTRIGTGAANTDAIISRYVPSTDYAAGLARAYRGGGYSDWYLPSKDELNKLYLRRKAIGGFHTEPGGAGWYWSSSQYAEFAYYAWSQSFGDGYQGYGYSEGDTYRVRAVRAS